MLRVNRTVNGTQGSKCQSSEPLGGKHHYYALGLAVRAGLVIIIIVTTQVLVRSDYVADALRAHRFGRHEGICGLRRRFLVPASTPNEFEHETSYLLRCGARRAFLFSPPPFAQGTQRRAVCVSCCAQCASRTLELGGSAAKTPKSNAMLFGETDGE